MDDINPDSENLFIDEEEEEELQLPEIICLMEEAWLNEKFSPEILPHKSEIVEVLLGQISHMENNITQLKNTDFKKGIFQMEIDRLRFLVASYLRIRLEKIETFTSHILKQEVVRHRRNEENYLNQAELEFAQEYEQNMRQHLDSILSSVPGITDSPDIKDVTPNTHTMVFLKSKKDVEGILIDGSGDDNDLIDLPSDSQILISYESVANLVKKGDVHLI